MFQEQDENTPLLTKRSDLRVALTLVNDALHGRGRHRLDPLALRIHQFLRSRYWAFFYGVLLLAYLALGIVEIPSTIQPAGPLNQGVWPSQWTFLAELLLLSIFAAEMAVRIRLHGWTVSRRHGPSVVKLVVLALCAVHVVLHALLPAVPRLHRIARPLLIGAHYRNVAKIFANMIRSIPRVANVSVLLAFHVLFFGVFAHLLFGGMNSDSCSATTGAQNQSAAARCSNGERALLCSPFDKCCTDYFGNFGNAINQLFILLTTANYPDVMQVAYDCNRWSAVFFIVYLVIGLIFIMNLILAVAYAQFQEQAKAKTLKAVVRRVDALDAAFDILVRSVQPALQDIRDIADGQIGAHRICSSAASDFSMDRFSSSDSDASVASSRRAGYAPWGKAAAGAAELSPPAAAMPTARTTKRAPTTTGVELQGASASSEAGLGHAEDGGEDGDGSVLGPALGPGAHLAREHGFNAVFSPPRSPELSTNGPAASAATLPAMRGFPAPAAAAEPEPCLQFDTWCELLAHLRPDLRPTQVNVLFHVLASHVPSSPAGVGITRADFRELSTFLEVRFRKRRHGAAREYLLGRKCAQTCPGLLSFRRWVRALVQSRPFGILFEALVYVAGVLILLQFGLSDSGGERIEWLSPTVRVLLYVFVLELVCKIVGLGVSGFLADGFNVLDLLVIPVAAVADMSRGYIGEDPADGTTTSGFFEKLAFLRMLRLLRALRALKGFGIVLKTLSAIVPTFLRYLAVMALVYYSFAIVGMELFAGTIQFSARPSAPFFYDMDSRLEKTAYYENNYWNNNFNSLTNALVVLFELMIVNNWAITMMAYAYATSYWSMAYFYAWFFIMVIVVSNIVTAFLIDDFTVMRARIAATAAGDVPLWEHRIREAMHAVGMPGAGRTIITRKMRTVHVYEAMFEDDVAAFLADIDEHKENLWEASYMQDHPHVKTSPFPELAGTLPQRSHEDASQQLELAAVAVLAAAPAAQRRANLISMWKSMISGRRRASMASYA